LTTPKKENPLRNFKSLTTGLVGLALTGLLVACGSSAGGGDELGPAPATSPTPISQGIATDGQFVYDRDCARCHSLQPHDAVGSPDLAGKGDVIAVKLQNSHMGNTLTSTELADVIAFANQGQVEEPGTGIDPNATLDGAALYSDFCSGCHGQLASTNKPGRTAAQTQAAIDGNVGNMGFLATLSATEIQAIADVLPAADPTPDGTGGDTGGPADGGTTTPDGTALYASKCSGCHGQLASTNKPGRTAAQTQAAIDGNVGNMGFLATLSATEIQAIADVLPAADSTADPTPTPQCGSCHALPPNGSAYPNGAGAHAVHLALPGVGNCAVCHPGSSAATHDNGWIDLSVAATYNAKTGAAAENPDDTPSCVTVSCHGGQTTPDWGTGTINVDTQCISCHARGTGQYNSYNSGQHGRSAHTSRACTACHNTTKLASTHFSRLDTPTMEGPASATVGGGTTRVSSYNASTRTCTTSCHGSENW
jgi:predicted CxxxxCH...CXXCH cytochrome family protein